MTFLSLPDQPVSTELFGKMYFENLRKITTIQTLANRILSLRSRRPRQKK
jgi:hypothetical protein